MILGMAEYKKYRQRVDCQRTKQNRIFLFRYRPPQYGNISIGRYRAFNMSLITVAGAALVLHQTSRLTQSLIT